MVPGSGRGLRVRRVGAGRIWGISVLAYYRFGVFRRVYSGRATWLGYQVGLGLRPCGRAAWVELRRIGQPNPSGFFGRMCLKGS